MTVAEFYFDLLSRRTLVRRPVHARVGDRRGPLEQARVQMLPRPEGLPGEHVPLHVLDPRSVITPQSEESKRARLPGAAPVARSSQRLASMRPPVGPDTR